jgi:hypothetical protein
MRTNAIEVTIVASAATCYPTIAVSEDDGARPLKGVGMAVSIIANLRATAFDFIAPASTFWVGPTALANDSII